ncbi:MAG: ABC transporter permease, partial [Anaerovoracaceae bacterium]
IGLRASSGVNGYSYLLWLIPGIFVWFFIQASLSSGTGCMTKYKFLITKMKFPISIIPTFVSLSNFFLHICLVVFIVLLFALYGKYPDIYYLQLPIYMVLLLLIGIAWSLFASIIAAMSKDFKELVSSLSMAIFWLSGVLWNPDTITIDWLKTLLMFNPITFLVTGYRNVFIYKVWFFEEPIQLTIFLVELMLLWILALLMFKRLKRDMPDVL